MTPEHPAIVGGIADLDTLSSLPQLHETIDHCDLLEFRIDPLVDHQPLLHQRMDETTVPLIVTVRDPAEGGLNGLAVEERARHMRAFLPHASLLDIEIRNLEVFAPVVAEARDARVTVLGSYHDFEATPSESTLLDTVERGRDRGADIVKIAVALHRAADLHTLLRVFEAQRSRGPMAIMGMGPLGMGSRVLFAQCGSLLTYTYLKRPNAPGQWSAERMRTLFADLGLP